MAITLADTRKSKATDFIRDFVDSEESGMEVYGISKSTLDRALDRLMPDVMFGRPIKVVEMNGGVFLLNMEKINEGK